MSNLNSGDMSLSEPKTPEDQVGSFFSMIQCMAKPMIRWFKYVHTIFKCLDIVTDPGTDYRNSKPRRPPKYEDNMVRSRRGAFPSDIIYSKRTTLLHVQARISMPLHCSRV